jgi:hypothetical protein
LIGFDYDTIIVCLDLQEVQSSFKLRSQQ